MSAPELPDGTDAIYKLGLAVAGVRKIYLEMDNTERHTVVSDFLTTADLVVETLYAINDSMVQARDSKKEEMILELMTVEVVPLIEMINDYMTMIIVVCGDPDPSAEFLSAIDVGTVSILDALKEVLATCQDDDKC